jgi:hypothetical protein
MFSDGFCFLDIPQNETTPDMFKCDDYFEANNVTVTRGIKGLASGVIMDNIRNIIVITPHHSAFHPLSFSSMP